MCMIVAMNVLNLDVGVLIELLDVKPVNQALQQSMTVMAKRQ